MKKLLFIFSIIALTSCTPTFWDDFTTSTSESGVNETSLIDTTEVAQSTIMTTEDGIPIPDFVPALQPFVNEGCNIAWDNLSAIVEPDGNVLYFINLPDYTPDSLDYDKSRFTFIFQARNPWYGIFPEETPYSMMSSPGWYTVPIDDYGNMTCEGLQEIRIWVYDELTETYYMNSQVCWAALLCNGQGTCDQGYSFDQIEYTPYDGGYLHIAPNGYTEY